MAKSQSTEPKKKKKGITRETELSTREEFAEDLAKVASRCEQAYTIQTSRSEAISDYWDIYNNILNDKQAYNGNSNAYIPLVADAVDARKTRFTNQLFPQNGRSVAVITQDGEIPHAPMALAEHYVRKSKLRTEVLPALCKNGDVEGQYSVYVSWRTTDRHVTSRKYVKEGGSMVDMVEEEIIPDGGPYIECIPDADLALWPATADSIQDALDMGGGVSITRRWTKATIEDLIEKGDIVESVGNILITDMDTAAMSRKQDIKKIHVWATGIHDEGKWYLAREVWHTMMVNGARRLVRSYFGAESHQLLGTKLCPFWCDRPPIISGPVEKQSGAFKGSSKLKRVATLQYAANDFLNEALDSATYSMLPIVMTDPEKNPKTSTMVLDLAAVWETSPNDTQFAKFPDLWQNGFNIISALKAQIQQSLSVNPSMMAATSGGKEKRSQADVANEQQVDILTTADAVTVLEETILTPMLQLIFYLDQQYRQDDLMVPMFGMAGKQAKMQNIPPLQMGNYYEFYWCGVQAARNAQQVQQQVSFLNVLRGIPPQMYKNHRVDATAMLEAAVENIFGPELAPKTFVDIRDELSMPQTEENELLMMGMIVPISPMDNDQEHIQELQPALAVDASGAAQRHLIDHQQAMQQKAQQAQMQQAQMMGLINAGQPPNPQNAQAMPGVMPPGGGPRQGAQAGTPRTQGPPGQISADSMPSQGGGVVPMPRKM